MASLIIGGAACLSLAAGFVVLVWQYHWSYGYGRDRCRNDLISRYTHSPAYLADRTLKRSLWVQDGRCEFCGGTADKEGEWDAIALMRPRPEE